MRVLLLRMMRLLSQLSDLLHQETLFVNELLIVCGKLLATITDARSTVA